MSATQASIDKLLKEYPETDSAPMAHVVAGRLALAKGRTPAEVDAALASFETCTVKIGNQDLGFPPIANKPIAAGNYQIDLICPNGQNQKGFATVDAGRTAEVRLR